MNRTSQVVEMLPRQAATYNDMCQVVMKSRLPLFDDPLGPILLTRLSMYATATARATDEGALVLNAPSIKQEVFRTLVHDHRRSDGAMVVFVSSFQFLNMLHTSAKKVWGYSRLAVVSSEQLPSTRVRMLSSWTGGDKPILLTTPGSLSIGVDLSRADLAVFLQRSWTPGEQEWALSKMSGTAEVLDVVSAGTVDVHQGTRIDDLKRRVIDTEQSKKAFLYGRPLAKGGDSR